MERPGMVSNRDIIGSYDQLKPGDAIEAFHRSVLVHRGPITDIAPDQNCDGSWTR
jgi:predicted small secreted protein